MLHSTDNNRKMRHFKAITRKKSHLRLLTVQNAANNRIMLAFTAITRNCSETSTSANFGRHTAAITRK